MSEEIHIGLNKETGKFEQVQGLPIAAVDKLLRQIEPTTVRTFILTNMSTSLKPDLVAVDHVEKNINEAVDVWTLKAPYNNASKFIQAVVRNDFMDRKKSADETDYPFMNVYNRFAATMVPQVIVDAFRGYPANYIKKIHGNNTRTRTSTV